MGREEREMDIGIMDGFRAWLVMDRLAWRLRGSSYTSSLDIARNLSLHALSTQVLAVCILDVDGERRVAPAVRLSFNAGRLRFTPHHCSTSPAAQQPPKQKISLPSSNLTSISPSISQHKMTTAPPEPTLQPPTPTTPHFSPSTPPPTTSTSTSSSTTFPLPPWTSFPPFYTLQPNLQTRARQYELWSTLLQTYARHHTLFRLSLSSPPPNLFSNDRLNRALKPSDVRALLDHLSKAENGGVVEWIPPSAPSSSSSGGRAEQSQAVYIWWRSPGEWADALYGWVEETGQKGAVLTLYELREGEAVRGKEWRAMEEGMLRRVLGVLVKRGKAQVFGLESGEGVKFF